MYKLKIKKKPKATKPNRKANAANGSLLSTIGLVVINADDHSKIKTNGNTLAIFFYNLKFQFSFKIILSLSIFYLELHVLLCINNFHDF